MANFFRSVLLRLQNKTVTAGTSASSVTKDSGYDGLGTVTINPTPSETKTQAAGTSNIDVTPSSGKLLSKVTVTPTPTETKSATPSTSAQTITPSSGKHLSSVSISAISTETKSQAAGTSNIDVTPTSGKYLTKVTITPQQHSGSFTPTANLKGASGNANDMGASHNNRYVDTSGMIVPSGAKSITANGTGIDVSSYATANVNVPNPTLSGNATTAYVYPGKTFYNNSYTKQTGTMTTKAAATYNTSTSDQTISSGQYLTGTQTIKAVKTANISAANIKSGVTVTVGDANSATRIANVAGTFTKANTVSSGQTAASASQIKSGYSAWVDGAEVKGSYTEPTINSITPSNSSPVSMSANSNYKPTATGYAISSYESKTPSNSSPISLSNGSIYKMGGAGYAISSYSTITPTDSPRAVTDGGIYKMDGDGRIVQGPITLISPSTSDPPRLIASKSYRMAADGYVIDNYTSVTPSTGGQYFDSGMMKMLDNGYAYSQRPYVAYNYTTLWENSNPGVNFAAQSVSLSQSITDFEFLLVEFYGHKYTYSKNYYESDYPQEYLTVFINVLEFISKTNSNAVRKIWPSVLSTGTSSSSGHYVRAIKYESNTTLYFTSAAGAGNTTASANDVAIPYRIKGLNLEINT